MPRLPHAIPSSAPRAALTVALALAAGLVDARRAGAQPPARTVAVQPPAAPAAAPPVVADSSVRDSTELRLVGRRYAGTVRNCYQEQGLKGDPMLRGMLRVELTVLPTGAVQEAAVTAADVSGAGMPAVTSCIATAARAWRFSDGAPAAERIVLEYDLVPPNG